MSNRSALVFLTLAFLGIPYAIVLTFVLEPLVLADRLNIIIALLAISTPTVLGVLGALASTPRR